MGGDEQIEQRPRSYVLQAQHSHIGGNQNEEDYRSSSVELCIGRGSLCLFSGLRTSATYVQHWLSRKLHSRVFRRDEVPLKWVNLVRYICFSFW
jgi:hypothetical protein